MDESNLTFTLFKKLKPIDTGRYELSYYKFSITRFIQNGESIKKELKNKAYPKKNIKDLTRECKCINEKELSRLHKSLKDWNSPYNSFQTKTNQVRVKFLTEVKDLFKTWYDGQGIPFPEKVIDKPETEGRNFQRGELKKKLEEYIKKNNLEKGETVPSKKINQIVQDLQKKNYIAKEASIRATFHRMGYSEPRAM